MPQSVVCPGCNRSYAVKPELAGKRVKCKCGGRIEFPESSPDVLSDLDLLDEPSKPAVQSRGRFEQLETAAPAAAQSPRAVAPPPIGSICDNCKGPLAPGTVLCTRCGFNQKTKSMMKTQVFSAPPMAPAPSKPQRSYSAGGGGAGMGKMLIGGVLVLIGIGVTVGTYSAANNSGGTYFVAYGPIIWGGIMFFRGLGQMLSGGG